MYNISATKYGHVYILTTDIPGIYKCGRTKRSITKRVSDLQTNCVDDIQILFYYSTVNNVLLESIVHFILDKYRINSKREHFQCSLDYIISIIEISGNMLNEMYTSNDNYSCIDIIKKCIDKSNRAVVNDRVVNTKDSPSDISASNVVIKSKYFL